MFKLLSPQGGRPAKRFLISAFLAALAHVQPVNAAPSLCWYVTPDSPDRVDAQDCDVTREIEDGLKVFYVDDIWRVTLWNDDTADVMLYDTDDDEWSESMRHNTYEDQDGDMNIEIGDGYRLIFRIPGRTSQRPTSDTISPGLTRGGLSDTPFRF